MLDVMMFGLWPAFQLAPSKKYWSGERRKCEVQRVCGISEMTNDEEEACFLLLNPSHITLSVAVVEKDEDGSV